MNIAQIEENLQTLTQNFSKEEFIFDLLAAYGIPRATITLLKKGKHNLSKQAGQIIHKNKLFFQELTTEDLHEAIDTFQKDTNTARHNPRFIVVTDYRTLLAVDTKTNDHLDIPIVDITKHYDFFLPWAGIEKHKHAGDNPADRKAAEKMAKLYDEISLENAIQTEERRHDLNVFLSRLLFCFFSEDTEIFETKLFTNSIASHTQVDGSDLSTYLDKLFDVLNSEERSTYPQYLQKFPYVNGGLFAKKHWIPTFSVKSRKIIIECGELDWSKINPDIFGSMMQAVVHPGERGSLGMHYTSVPNILKVIGPLFLDDLKQEFEQNIENKAKLHALLNRIARIKFLDPACGSGNFLIISYKELRQLEMAIIKQLGILAFPGINLSQFYGIEIDDFAHEIAKLSLYLAQHQMNIEFKQEFGKVNPTLPLKTGGNIICANATRIEWESVCKKETDDEIVILGNPPYIGSFLQSKEQKADLAFVCKDFRSYKDLDYIACWFIKGARFIENSQARFAFVTTNSICQGEQVILLWPFIFSKNLEIFFGYQSFKWVNNAKNNAGVYCTIIGLRNQSGGKKKIYTENIFQVVDNISPYLSAGKSVIISKRMKPLSLLPAMSYGSKIVDGGHLIFSVEERNELLQKYPQTEKLFKKLAGSAEFIRSQERWCLYIKDSDLEFAMSIEPIRKRLDQVRLFRQQSSESSTVAMSEFPHKFYYSVHRDTHSIIVPSTSSERRTYIPIGFLNGDTVVSNAASVIFDAEPWIFSVLTSCMHMVWVRAVAGRLKTDYRYSSQLCYNTFPIPLITAQKKEELTQYTYSILEEREKHSQKTLAQLYDPNNMPIGLKEAHHGLDLAIDRCYRSKPFVSNEERLEYLFKLYTQMIEEERVRNIS